jgi:hypothetical protein
LINYLAIPNNFKIYIFFKIIINVIIEVEKGNISFNDQSISDLNDKLMKYKELKILYRKTLIKPIYYYYILLICLTIITIGYMQTQLTCLIGITYPMYFSIKALRDKNKDIIKKWLKYWIIFSFFLNLEDALHYYFYDLELYFFYKVIFLLICYLPQYDGANFFYENFVREIFINYENQVCNIGKNIVFKIKDTLLEKEEDI